jgi:hypothetical protein
MQVFQTDGVPPSGGKTIRATIGCTRKSKAALRNRVVANNNRKELSP